MISNNVLSADNQQERLQKFNPWYISGFVDGEGSFHVAIYKDLRMRTNLKIIPEFHISQNESSGQVLERLKRFFGCGNIKVNHRGRKSDRTLVYVVRNRKDLLNKIIPFFSKYSLQTMKAKDFSIFAEIVKKVNTGEHRTKVGVKQIVNLAFTMNDGGKRRTTQKTDLIKFVESSETIRETSRKLKKI